MAIKSAQLTSGIKTFFDRNPGPDPMKGEKTGTDGWGWSYQGMFVAEYYLRTGDTHVLPYLKWLREIAETGMGAAGGGISPGWVMVGAPSGLVVAGADMFTWLLFQRMKRIGSWFWYRDEGLEGKENVRLRVFTSIETYESLCSYS